MIDEIPSIKNETVIQARTLHSAAGRRENNKCLLEGEEIISWALTAGWSIELVFIVEKSRNHAFIKTLEEKNIPCFIVSEGIIKKISQTNYVIPIIGISRFPHYENMMDDFVIVLDDVCDHGNLGTIVRTACAFGIHDILSTNPESDFFYRKIIDASRGAVFNMRFKVYSSASETIADLKRRGFTIIATSPHAKHSQSLVKLPEKRIALVIGNETRGVSAEVLNNADLVVQIPTTNTVESLNVGVAAGISLYELKLKQVILMLKKNIQTSLGREVNVTGKLIQKAFDEKLRFETPYNSEQIIFLMILKCDVEMTRSRICKDLALIEHEFEEMIEPLISDELVIERENHSYNLSGKGELYLGQIWGLVETIENEIFIDLTKEERDRFIDALKRMQKRCIMIIDERSEMK